MMHGDMRGQNLVTTSKQLFYDVLWSIIGVYPCHFIEAAGLLNS
jgi:hypothetical protein